METESSCGSVNSFVSYWFAVSLEAVSKPSSAAIKTLFGVMRFRGSGFGSGELIRSGVFFQRLGGRSRIKWAPCWKELFFIVRGVETVPTSLSSPSYQSRAPLTSLSPCLLESTIWSILCLPTSCSRTSPPWPPNSLHLSTPATIHLIMQKHTHTCTRTTTLPDPPRYLNHFTGNNLLAVSRKGEMETRGAGRVRTAGQEGSRAGRKHTMAAAMLRITALQVLRAGDMLSIC